MRTTSLLCRALQVPGSCRRALTAGSGVPVRCTAPPSFAKCCKQFQTIAPACGSSDATGARKAALSCGNLSWVCTDASARVARRGGAGWLRRTFWMARPTWGKVPYVHPDRLCAQGRFCGEHCGTPGHLAVLCLPGAVSRYGAPPRQVLQNVANSFELLHLHVAPATPLGRGTPRYYAEISRGYARMRLYASRAAVEQVGSVARFGWHAPPGVKCHTCILTVYAHKVASVASTAVARVISQCFVCRERCPGTVHRPAKFCTVLQTIANYCTCMWLQRRHWGAGRRAIMRQYLLGMHGCICTRRAPRRSKLVPSHVLDGTPHLG